AREVERAVELVVPADRHADVALGGTAADAGVRPVLRGAEVRHGEGAVSSEGERAARLAQREDLPCLQVRARGVAGLDGIDLALDPAEDAAFEAEEVRGGLERGVQLVLEARG